MDISISGVTSSAREGIFPGTDPYVIVTDRRGFNPSELAEMCVNKILAVSADLPPDELAKAYAYRDRIRAVITVYMAQAQKSQNTTTYNELMNAGHPVAAEIVKDL